MSDSSIFVATQTANCLLCHQGACTSGCPNQLPVDQILRSLRFENEKRAIELLGDQELCSSCENKGCEANCVREKIDRPLPIRELMITVSQIKKASSVIDQKGKRPVSLQTQLCHIPCENPFFLSSSVVGSNYEMVAKAFDLGWAGVAFKTIGMFVPNEVSPRFDQFEKEGSPFIGFKNIEQISEHTLEENLSYFRELKKNYPTKIIIASIMGQNDQEWETLARLVEEAGADIIECNFSCPHMTGEGLGSDVGTNPQLVAQYTRATKRGSSLPVLAKMTPNISNMELPALAAIEAGANGLAAINTIKSIMNINLTTFSSGPNVDGATAVGGYSGRAVKPIALRFISELKQHPALAKTPISGMGGIENWKDAAEFIALGCSTVQVTTAVMQYGYRIIDDLIDGLTSYCQEFGFLGIEDLLNKGLTTIQPADELNRHSICFPKFQQEHCVGCGRCYLSCFDGGHQAITFEKDHKPRLIGKKCVGCHLCVTVCPANAISPGVRVEKHKLTAQA